MIDFEKCFDRIDYDAIRGVLKYFGFGECFVKMIFLLFTEIEVCTLSNGYASKVLTKGRGCNQGCPCSPMVYNNIVVR